MTAGYDTLIVTFSDPIKVLDNMFSDGKYEVYADKRAYGSHQIFLFLYRLFA